jgi:hypothetical protein
MNKTYKLPAMYRQPCRVLYPVAFIPVVACQPVDPAPSRAHRNGKGYQEEP